MSKFEELCYLIACRQQANVKRRYLLYKLYKKRNANRGNWSKWIKHASEYEPERQAYRNQADMMKKIAKEVYSPMRRELNATIKYDGNNHFKYMIYQGQEFDFKKIKEIADGYVFDSILLEGKTINNPYEV